MDNLLANTQPVDQAPLPKVAATPVAATPVAATPVAGVPAGAGPFNAAASLSTKVTRKILALELVEMSEITVDPDMPQVPGRPPPPARPPITDISQWVERFSLMAAVLTTRFPEKAPELWAYQASIVWAERNYEGSRWVTYDRQYRREALARRDLNWTPGCIMKPSLAGPGQSPVARTASRMTTQPPSAHKTQIARW